jgi:hypothetical protein
MEYWQEFIRYEHANSVMMALGALLVFISIMQIVKSSLKMLFWVSLAGLGAASLSYGFEHSPFDLPALDKLNVKDVKTMAPDLDGDVLDFLCQKIDQATGT